MINIENRQNKIKIDFDWVRSEIAPMLKALGYPNFTVNIAFVDNAESQRYNKKFRNKNEPTDIISFPLYPETQPGQSPDIPEDGPFDLGDFVISLERVELDAQELGTNLKERLKHLFAHGLCHLLGYTHYDPTNDEKMKALEKKLLSL